MKMLRNMAIPLFAFGMLAFAVYHLLFADEVRPPLPPPFEPPAVNSANVVAGVGIVEPKTENISIGTAQSGIVLDVFYTSDRVGVHIRKGEALFVVDDRSFRAQLAHAEANLESAMAELAKLEQMPRPEDVPPLEARVKATEALVGQWKDKFERADRLESGLVAREDIVQRKLSLAQAQQESAQARAELERVKAGAWKPDVSIARAKVEVAQANVDLLKTEIDRCVVRSPIDGQIIQVNVRPGERVSGDSTRALMVAGNLDELRFRADFDEQEIPRFDPNAAAFAVLRGNSKQKVNLKFVRVEPYVVPKKTLSGDAAERVDTRVLQVVYSIEPNDVKIFVGQQLDVFVDLSKGSVHEVAQNKN